jgi:hypothetical protein
VNPGRPEKDSTEPDSEVRMEPTGAAGAIAVANAPVSYGAFEVTVGHDPNVPDGLSVLDQVAEAGYAGIDLGPAGYLGPAEVLGERLAERGLGLAGAYLELPYADPTWTRYWASSTRSAGTCRAPRRGRRWPTRAPRRGAPAPAGP